MSRIDSRKPARITIETEDQIFYFTTDDWQMHLDQPRIDMSHVGSPNLMWVPAGRPRASLEFSITDSSRGGPKTAEAGLEVLRRYMKMMGVDD